MGPDLLYFMLYLMAYHEAGGGRVPTDADVLRDLPEATNIVRGRLPGAEQ